MDSFFQMFQIQMSLMVYLCVGFLCYYKQIITKQNQQKFVAFVLNFLMPCMVFQSFKNVSVSLLTQSLQVLFISFFICFISFLLGKVLYRSFPLNKRNVLRYSTMINNAGFAGLPLAKQLYGDTGLIYASIFLIPIRIFMWSAGITMLSNQKSDWKKILKQLIHNPNIIAVVLGIFRGLLQIPLPLFFDNALTHLSDCVSPLSMIIIGSIIAQISITSIMEKGVLYYTLIRLFLLPLLVLCSLTFFHFDPVLIGTCVILTAMPAATSTALLASQYGSDSSFASKIIFLSTICSLFTAPLFMLFL